MVGHPIGDILYCPGSVFFPHNSHRACDLQHGFSAFLLLDTLSCHLGQLLHPVPLFSTYDSPAAQVSSCLILLTNAFDFFEISVPGSFCFLLIFFLWVLPGFSISQNDPRLLGWSSKFCSYQHLWFPCTPSLCSISRTTPQAWLSVVLCLHAYLVARENFLSLVENTYPWSPALPSSSEPPSILSFLGSLSFASYITDKSPRSSCTLSPSSSPQRLLPSFLLFLPQWRISCPFCPRLGTPPLPPPPPSPPLPQDSAPS